MCKIAVSSKNEGRQEPALRSEREAPSSSGPAPKARHDAHPQEHQNRGAERGTRDRVRRAGALNAKRHVPTMGEVDPVGSKHRRRSPMTSCAVTPGVGPERWDVGWLAPASPVLFPRHGAQAFP